MRYTVLPIVAVVIIGFVGKTESTGLLGLAPLLGAALGALKVAVTAKAGLALGIIGTSLGSTALGVALKAKLAQEESEPYYSYGGYEHNYNAYRKKRDLQNHFDVEEAFEHIQKSDPTHCAERMICDLSRKAYKIPKALSRDEYAILSLVGSKNGRFDKISKAHHTLETAMKYGFQNMDCSAIFRTCPFSGRQLMSLANIVTAGIMDETPESLIRFIKT